MVEWAVRRHGKVGGVVHVAAGAVGQHQRLSGRGGGQGCRRTTEVCERVRQQAGRIEILRRLAICELLRKAVNFEGVIGRSRGGHRAFDQQGIRAGTERQRAGAERRNRSEDQGAIRVQ